MTTDPAGAQTFYTKVLGGDWIAQCLDPQGAAFALHLRKG